MDMEGDEVNPEIKEMKDRFEEIFEVPDFIDFDGEDYLYFGEDPLLNEQAENIHAEWRGFQKGFKVSREIAAERVIGNYDNPKHETPDQYKARTGKDIRGDVPVWWYQPDQEDWICEMYEDTEEARGQKEYMVIANEHGKPDKGWRPA